MIAIVSMQLEFGNSYYASFGDKYGKDWERLQIVLCKYCWGDLQMRERGVKERDKRGIRVKCRYTSDITCSYFTGLHLNINSEHRLGVLTQCVSHTWSAKGSGKFYFGFWEVRFASMDKNRFSFRCAVNFNILPRCLALNRTRPYCCCTNSQKGESWKLRGGGGYDCVVLFFSSSSEPLVPPLCYDPSCYTLFVLPHSFLSLSISPRHFHPTVPFECPHERLQTPTAPLHFPPDHPPFCHLHPFLVRLLPLSNAPLHHFAPSLAGQDLYAGALCHQRVPGPHPPHPTDLRLLSTFPRLPLHATASQGEEDPKRGDFQWGDGWRVQRFGEERDQRCRQGGGARLWWRWQWVLRRVNKVL